MIPKKMWSVLIEICFLLECCLIDDKSIMDNYILKAVTILLHVFPTCELVEGGGGFCCWDPYRFWALWPVIFLRASLFSFSYLKRCKLMNCLIVRNGLSLKSAYKISAIFFFPSCFEVFLHLLNLNNTDVIHSWRCGLSPASAFLHEIQSNRRWTDNYDNSGDMLTPGHFLGI